MIQDDRLQWREFANSELLARCLADVVSSALARAIARRAKASLVVSGGSTPRLFLTKLAGKDIRWRDVEITLVDERLVDQNDLRSNAAMVRTLLLRNKAQDAVFVPLYRAGMPDDDLMADRCTAVLNLLNDGLFDVVLLGMGNDGHTASLFPGGDNLEPALAGNGHPLLFMNAPGADEPRITFTPEYILKTRNLLLHIEGAKKKQTLLHALAPGAVNQMPIRAIIAQDKVVMTAYWTG